MPEIATKSGDEGGRVADRLRAAARSRILGRADELAWLERALLDEESPAVFVHGIGGIGKTSLLDAAEARLEGRGCRLVRLTGDEVEPTPEGLLRALAAALREAGAPTGRAALDEVVAAIAGLPDAAIVLAIDEYDALRLVDAWIRRTFLPALPARARMLFVGRSRPVSAWTAAPGWDALVRTLELGPMSPEESAILVDADGVSPDLRAKICAIAGGHPLALKLATAAARVRPDLPVSELQSRHVVGELVRRFLSDLRDPKDRAALDAASVLRRVTRPLLAAMLGDEAGDHALETLRGLPFVETGADGLVVHQSVRNAVATTFRSVDPSRYRELRTRAWERLGEELTHASMERSPWHLTADIVYLLDEPNIRDAFFPSDTIRYAIEPALPTDRDAILAIASTHAGEAEARAIAAWWEHAPSAFLAARDEDQRLEGYYVAVFERDVPPALDAIDPLLARWRAHARARFGRSGRPVLLSRSMLSAGCGVRRCEARAACFLDLKRTYMENLDLAAFYTANYDGSEAFICDRFGFEALPELAHDAGAGRGVTTAVLDFGPGVMHWLGRLIEAQWTRAHDGSGPRAFFLCRLGRELWVEGERKALTRLEYGVLDHLEKNAGAVASREELLESVWGQAHTGSNVVDVVVRSIRKKLGVHASAIQTVTGHGYRLRAE